MSEKYIPSNAQTVADLGDYWPGEQIKDFFIVSCLLSLFRIVPSVFTGYSTPLL